MAGLSSVPVGGYRSGSQSNDPFLDIKKNVGEAYDQVTQPIQGILDPYQRGITDSVLTRNATNQLLQSYGEGQRNQINQDFQTTANNVSGGLASRGFGGSSLQLTSALGVERDRQLALGNLGDRITGMQLGNSQNYAQLIAQQTGQAGDAQVSLMRALLGLTEGEQTSTAPIPGGGGSSGGGGGSDEIPPPLFGGDHAIRGGSLGGGGGMTGGGQQAGGGGGGSGGGGSAGGGGGGQSITNPYYGGDGSNVTDGSETGKNWPAVPPTGPIPLIPDKGPRLTPDEYAENQKRLAQAKAEGRTTVFGGNYVGDVNSGDPGQV